MSCNCGCHDDKPAAAGWRQLVPLIVGLAVAGTLIAAAAFSEHDKGAKQITTGVRP